MSTPDLPSRPLQPTQPNRSAAEAILGRVTADILGLRSGWDQCVASVALAAPTAAQWANYWGVLGCFQAPTIVTFDDAGATTELGDAYFAAMDYGSGGAEADSMTANKSAGSGGTFRTLFFCGHGLSR